MGITARGKHGTIDLDSASLVWTPSSSMVAANNSSEATGCSTGSVPSPHASCLDAAAPPFVRVDANRLEAVGFSDGVRLSAGRSFNLAVAGAGVGQERGARNVQGGRPEGETGEREEDGRRSMLSGSGLTAALLKGDSGSLNASAGVVKVEVSRTTVKTKNNPVWNHRRERTESRAHSPKKALLYTARTSMPHPSCWWPAVSCLAALNLACTSGQP